MSMAQAIVAELQHESQLTRGLFDAIPEEHLDYKAHPKSMSIREVASHIAESMAWSKEMIDADHFEMDPEAYKPWVAESKQDLMETLDRNTAEAIDKIRPLDDEKMLQTWTMSVAGKQMMQVPRVGVIKSMLINHAAHHRGQLTVYLRMNDVPLPQIYGPTADAADMS